MGFFEKLYTWGGGCMPCPPIFSEKVSEGGGFCSYIHVSISKLSFHANFQTFSKLCSENRAIIMIFDFAEIRSQVGKLI